MLLKCNDLAWSQCFSPLDISPGVVAGGFLRKVTMKVHDGIAGIIKAKKAPGSIRHEFTQRTETQALDAGNYEPRTAHRDPKTGKVVIDRDGYNG